VDLTDDDRLAAAKNLMAHGTVLSAAELVDRLREVLTREETE
jgi:hypothetical protein